MQAVMNQWIRALVEATSSSGSMTKQQMVVHSFGMEVARATITALRAKSSVKLNVYDIGSECLHNHHDILPEYR